MTARKSAGVGATGRVGRGDHGGEAARAGCGDAHRRAEADVTRLRDAVIDAHADRDEAKAAKASREHDKADRTTLRDAAERLEGARRAVAKAEAERGLYAAENVDVLIAERAPDARAGAAAVEQAVEQLGRAYAQWTGVESDVASLLRAAGRKHRDAAAVPVR